jgi:hypothetical protein
MNRSRLTTAFALVVSTSASGASSPTAPLEQALAARHIHPAELQAEARLAEARQQLARSSGLLLGGATISLATGPRRTGGPSGDESSTDVAAGIDLPLLFARDEQRALAAAIDAATSPMRSAARATAELELELAYLAAWRDGAEAAFRDRELGLVDEWLAATRRRVEAGADPPYEATVAAGERQRVAVERDVARARSAESRLALAALCNLPAGELSLVAPADSDADAIPGSVAGGARRLAVERAAELEIAGAALATAAESARWSLASQLAREGDEEIARLGLAYRIAPRGQRRSAAEELAAATRAIRRRAELESASVDERFAAARSLLAGSRASVDEADLSHAFEALATRVAEGKERPGAVLAQRRALVDAQIALLESRHARAAAAAELRALTSRVQP